MDPTGPSRTQQIEKAAANLVFRSSTRLHACIHVSAASIIHPSTEKAIIAKKSLKLRVLLEKVTR